MDIRIRDLVTDIISGEWGGEPLANSGTKVIRTSNFTNNGEIDFNNLAIREIAHQKVQRKKLLKGDIIIEKSGGSPSQPVGRVVFFNISTNEDYICNNFTTILRPNQQIVSPDFLFYQLLIAYHKGKTLKYQNKTTGIINLKLVKYLNEKIKVPSLTEQKKLVAILKKAEAIIKQRKENIDLLDEFVRSTFLKMFGNPVLNEKKWVKKELINFVAQDCPVTYGIVQPGDNYPEGIPVVRPIDLNQDNVSLEGLKLIDPQISKKYKRTILSGNEILMSVRGTTGVVTLAKSELRGCNITRGVTALWFKDDLDKYFVLHLLKSLPIQNEISNKTYGAALKQINLSELRKLKLIDPPFLVKKDFSQIANKVSQLKERLKSNLVDIENLYKALSQKVFNGENIDLSKIQIETTEQFATPEKPTITKLENSIDLAKEAKKENPEKSVWETIRVLAGQKKNLPFSSVEGDAVIRLAFSKKTNGFTFQEFDEFLKKEGFVYHYEEIKDFIFSKLESKELVQYYASKEWMKYNYKPQISPFQDDFAGVDGNIWFVPQQSRS